MQDIGPVCGSHSWHPVRETPGCVGERVLLAIYMEWVWDVAEANVAKCVVHSLGREVHTMTCACI